MKYIIYFSLWFFNLNAKSQMLLNEPDKSPLDISYAPMGFPILKFQNSLAHSKPLARVIYSRPQVNGRKLFGEEIKYQEIWRLGANEATELEFFGPVNMGGKKVAKGRYTLFCIPSEKYWILILNKETDSWGNFNYKATADLLRISASVQKTDVHFEYFTMYFDPNNHLVIQWSDVKVVYPIQYLK